MAPYPDGTAALVYLRLGETSGNMLDYSGNNHNFSVFGSSGTRGVTGLVGGDTDKAYRVDSVSFSMHCYLFQESWMQFTGAFGHRVIVAPSNVSLLAQKTIMRRANPVESIKLIQVGSTSNYTAQYEAALTGGGTITLNGTTQVTATAGSTNSMTIAVSWAGAGTPVKLWVNGVVEASSIPASSPTRGSTFTIGTWDQANYTFPFTGVIDEYALYNYDIENTPVATKRIAGVASEVLVLPATVARQVGGVASEVLLTRSDVLRQVGAVGVEVLVSNAVVPLDYGIVAAGAPTTGILIKQADGSWRAVYPA